MQLYIKQRVFSWSDTYDVYDESGTPRYYVRAEVFSFGHQIHVFEKASGREVGAVHQELFTLLPKFEIVMDGCRKGTVRREFTFFKPRYRVDFLDWVVEGDLFGWEYTVNRGDDQVMTVSKELFTWGDAYVLHCWDEKDALAGLLLAVAIDAANCGND